MTPLIGQSVSRIAQPHKLLRCLTWVEPFWVSLLGIPITMPGKFLPLAWHIYLLAALFLFWPLRWLNKWQLCRIEQHRQRHNIALGYNPTTVPLLVLLAWLPANLWASSDLETSSLSAGYLLFGIALFVAFVNWHPAQCHPYWVAWLLLLVGTGLAIVSPLLVAWKPEFRLFYLPLYDELQAIDINLGETIHANVLAGALVTILPFLLILSLQKLKPDTEGEKLQNGKIWIRIRPNRFVSKLLFSLCFLYVLGMLVLTQSRSGYLAIVVALPVVLILRWRYLLYVVLPSLLILILIINQLNFNSLLNQLSSDGSLGGWGGRLDIWTQSASAFYDFPFTGIGIGTFTRLIPLLYPLSFNIEIYPHAHNLFLQVGLDLGIPGLIAYLALLINVFVMLVIALRSTLYHTLAIGATGSLIAILVQGLLDAVTWGTKLAFMPWLLFAVITLLFQSTVEEQVNPLVQS